VIESICIFRPATEGSLKIAVIVKTVQMFHHHYTVKDKAQEAVFFKYQNIYLTNLFLDLLQKEIPAKRGMHH